MQSFIDQLEPAWAFASTLLVLAVAVELGFRAALVFGSSDSNHTSMASLLAGALLGILGLILGFGFSMAQDRFTERRQLVLNEANAIGTTFLRAEALPDPHADQVRNLLREYVALRIAGRSPTTLPSALARSGQLHEALWSHAYQLQRSHPRELPIAQFVSSLNDVIDLHQERVTVTIYMRLPTVIVLTLYTLAALALALLGYAGGLTRTRSPLPVAAVLLGVSSVLALIMALDSPQRSTHAVSMDALESLQASMGGPER